MMQNTPSGEITLTPTPSSLSPKSPRRRNRANPTSTVSFNNHLIFGKGFARAIKTDGCAITQLINDGVLAFDGTINTTFLAPDADKRPLWLYIRYLWQFNHQKPQLTIFQNMAKDEANDLPLARHFVAEVLAHKQGALSDPAAITTTDAIAITPLDLAAFINFVMSTYADAIDVPIIKNLLRLVMDKLRSDNANPLYTVNALKEEFEKHKQQQHAQPIPIKITNTTAPTAADSANQAQPPLVAPIGQVNITDKGVVTVEVKVGGGKRNLYK